MRKSIIIIVILISKVGVSQYICPLELFDLLNNKDTINLITQNKKEGLWINYETKMSCYDCSECDGGYAVLSFLIKSRGHYENNNKTGKWEYFNSDNSIKRISKYEKGLLDSIDTEYGNNAAIITKTYYQKGLKDSLLVFNESGHIKSKLFYKENQLRELIIYHSNGRKKYHAFDISNYNAQRIDYLDMKGEAIKLRDNDIESILEREGLLKYAI